MTQFKEGDKVRLKSGGPLMTIKEITKGDMKLAVCQWFEAKTLKEGRFSQASLEADDGTVSVR